MKIRDIIRYVSGFVTFVLVASALLMWSLQISTALLGSWALLMYIPMGVVSLDIALIAAFAMVNIDILLMFSVLAEKGRNLSFQ